MDQRRNGTGTPVLVRPRLAARTDGARAVVLSAPSGYGKSTLAAQLAAAVGGPVARCRFSDADASDGGAARLLGALADAHPHLGDQPPVADRTGPARLAYVLSDVVGPGTVLLEELHLLGDRADGLLESVLDGTVDSVTVVATTESDPPATVIRRVARGEAVLLGAADLLLDAEECDELAALLGSDLPGSEVAARSGGWPLAAAALARTGGPVEDALAADVVAELTPAARDVLAAAALLASVPRDAGSSVEAAELERFARRHPALLEVDADRFRVRDPLRAALGPGGPSPEGAAALADRLERTGHADDALVLLSRLGDGGALLQDRLESRGAALLDAGRYTLVRDLVTTVPAPQRRPAVRVLDAAAALGLDQVAPHPTATFRIDETDLLALADGPDLDDDLRLAVSGLRADFLRRRGDPRVVEVALGAVSLVGDVGPDAVAAELVAGRHPLARRGTFQVLYALGAAAQFSGDAGMIAEGARLVELSFRVAEASGIDTVPLRGQAAYERTLIGLVWSDEALAPLEAAVQALTAVGHPEAANLLVELADTHLRCGDAASGRLVAEAATDWARRTGNDLALPTAAMASAGLDLLERGPSADNDRDFDAAWEDLVATPRLRRALPSLAARVANAMLDHGDTERARRWLERGRARAGDLVQSAYQAQFQDSVEERLSVQLGTSAVPAPFSDDRFAAQPAGRLERWATLAWDARRRGDDGPAAIVTREVGDQLHVPWPRRLAGTGPAAVAEAPAPLRVRLLVPELRVERRDHPVGSPSGHAARLLALLVVADGSATVDAVVEDLWPDADPSAARNRLHQVLHRLRRALGVGADGPLKVVDGVVRLDLDEVTSDVRDLRTLDAGDRDAALDAVRSYEAHLCAAQFAYDDAFDDARWELSRRLCDVAAGLLDGDGARDPDAVGAVRDAWHRLPDEDRLGRELADALDRAGEADRAEEIRSRLEARA